MSPGTRCDEILKLIDEVLEKGAGAASDERVGAPPRVPERAAGAIAHGRPAADAPAAASRAASAAGLGAARLRLC